MNTYLPRGLRNNNPLNIRRNTANKWLGATTNITDAEFETFSHITYGIRAAMIIVRGYLNNARIKTPQDIIFRWAPPTENNTTKYISSVIIRTNLAMNSPIKFNDRTKICKLLQAMAIVECGANFANFLPISLFLETYDKYFKPKSAQ